MTFQAAQKGLEQMGYTVEEHHQDPWTLKTGWRPTSVDSHYIELFGREDYGTVGAYYRLLVEVTPDGGGSQASIRAVPRSTVPNIKSSGRLEKKLFKRMGDLLRSEEIVITNVGVQE